MLRRLADLTRDAAKCARLCVQRGRVLEERLEDLPAARGAYGEAVRADGTLREAHEGLVRVAEKLGEVAEGIRACDEWARVEPSATARADLHVRAAQLLLAHGRYEEAFERCERAFDADPLHRGADELTERLAQRSEDARALLASLERRLDRLQRIADTKTSDLVYLGSRIALEAVEKLGDTVRARRAAESVLSFDPRHPAARLVLAELAHAEARHHEALSHAELGQDRAGVLTPGRLTRLLLVVLEARVATDANREAVDQAAEAVLVRGELGPAELERVSAATAQGGSPAVARATAERWLQEHERLLTLPQRAAAHLRIGRASIALGDLEAGRRALQASLAAKPLPEAWQALAELEVTVGEGARALEMYEHSLRSLDESGMPLAAAAQARVLVRMSDIAGQELGNPRRRREYLIRSMAIAPEDRPTLTRMMRVYSDAGDWEELLVVLRRLAAIEANPSVAARYHRAAAELLGNQLARESEALKAYELAVDTDSTVGAEVLPSALELARRHGDAPSIDRLLRAAARIALERGENEEAARRLDELADHRASCRDEAGAAEPLAEAEDFSPAAERRQRLAQIYEQHLDRFAELAIDLGLRRVQLEGIGGSVLRPLARAFAHVGATEATHTLQQVLRVLGEPPPAEAGWTSGQQRTAGPARLQPNEAAAVAHPALDPDLTALFAALEPAVIAASSRPLRELGYPESMEVDLKRFPLPIARQVERAAAFLSTAPPAVFASTRDDGELSIIVADPPALLLGAAALQTSIDEAAAYCDAVHALVGLQPGHYLCHLVPSAEQLIPWVLAAGASVVEAVSAGADLEAQRTAGLAIRDYLTSDETGYLAEVVARLATRSPPPAIAAWWAAVAYTADRIALIACGDVELTLARIAAHPRAGGPSAAQRKEQLLRFAVSREHLSFWTAVSDSRAGAAPRPKTQAGDGARDGSFQAAPG